MFDLKNANVFSTCPSYTAVQAAAKVIATNTSSKMFLTGFAFVADTNSSFTIFEDTTTTKFIYKSTATNASSYVNFDTPIEIALNSGVHLTTTATNSTIFISGFTV